MPDGACREKHQDKPAIPGGVCVQTMPGFDSINALIQKPGVCFPCSKEKAGLPHNASCAVARTVEEPVWAYDLIFRMAKAA